MTRGQQFDLAAAVVCATGAVSSLINGADWFITALLASTALMCASDFIRARAK